MSHTTDYKPDTTERHIRARFRTLARENGVSLDVFHSGGTGDPRLKEWRHLGMSNNQMAAIIVQLVKDYGVQLIDFGKPFIEPEEMISKIFIAHL